MKYKELVNLIQSAHINFLFGSGLSRPYLSTLGNIEKLLYELSLKDIDKELGVIVQSSIIKHYFDTVMKPNIASEIVSREDEYNEVLDEYKNFFKHLNSTMNNRHSGLLSKQVNIFSTNIDTFVECAAEAQYELNDGFRGRMKPVFDADCFNKIQSRESLFFHYKSESPTFNYMKIHGSVNWVKTAESASNGITLDENLNVLTSVQKVLELLGDEHFIDFSTLANATIEQLIAEATVIKDKPNVNINDYERFMNEYSHLVMINPTKDKFRETVIDVHFYELMRLYSNALEKPNSVLFVQGFSFADEHISQVTVRAANNNPTLLIIVFAYNNDAKKEITDNLRKGGTWMNSNIKGMTTEDFTKEQDNEDKEKCNGLVNFDFKSINKCVFEVIANWVNRTIK